MRVALVVALPLLATALRVSPKNGTAVAVEVDAQEASDIRSLISSVNKVRADISKDANPDARKARQRLLDRVQNEVQNLLPEEKEKLQAAFHSPKAVPASAPLAKKGHKDDASYVAKLLAKHGKPRTTSREMTECGTRLLAASVGIKVGQESARFFGSSFLQDVPGMEEQYVSYALPGSGSDQVVADEGRSAMGQVKGEEPYVTVYKDGYWNVGCVYDVMWVDFDKYSDNKDKYSQDATYLNASVAVYKELVLKEKQKPMKSQLCFEFCRTIDGMAFFGLQGGRTCYCTPYYKASSGGEGSCDLPCEGNQLEMCGGKSKSSIFEMHTCGDKGAALTEKAAEAGEVLSAFYAAAVFADTIAKQLQATGAALQDIAGQGGDPDSSDMGQAAKVFAGDLEHVMMDGSCVDDYNLLLTTYEEAEATSLLNMKNAQNMQKASDASDTMETQMEKVTECMRTAHTSIQASYPPYEDALEAASDKDFEAKQEEYGTAISQYLPLSFVLKNKDPPKMSMCTGEPLGKPTVASMPECAQACDDLVFPDKCIAFQYFHVSEVEGASGNLCFLYKEVKALTTYDCGAADGLVSGERDRVKAAAEKKEFLLQSNVSLQLAQALVEDPEEKVVKIEASMCNNVLEALSATGMTCTDMFGADHSVKDTCAAVCERSKGMKYSAACMSKFSEISSGTKAPEMKTKGRCFGGKNEEVDGPSPGPPVIPFDADGMVLAGDVKIGAQTVLEPIIWTVPVKDDEK